MRNRISLVSLLKEKGIVSDYVAMEAGKSLKPDSKTVNPDESMHVALVTDRIIMNSNLKPVTDPIPFSTGGMRTPGGLFSEEIFGRTDDEKRRQFAYIELHETFFHPYVYEVLKALMPKRFDKCASGQGAWRIASDGELQEVKKDEKDYDEDNSGIAWLIKNYKKMSFKESGSMIRTDRIKLLKDLSDEEVFITKWLVVPIIYRDLDKNSSIHKLPELNTHYQSVIRYANSLRDSTFSFFNNQARYNLQMELVTIRKYGQSLIEKKHGFFHKSILGKSIDRGSGDVISTPSMRGYQRPEDNPIDVLHSGIPLAKCLIMGYDFILRYCLQFFADNFRNVTEYPVYKLVGDEYKIVGSVKLADQIARFSSKFLEKRINRFKNSHGTRFEPITLLTADGQEIPMHMSGQFAPTANRALASTILNRPMTWTDLFYLAAENTLSDKYVYITRYPVESHNHIFPSNIRVMSTIKTVPAYVDGTFYPRYPYIDLSTDTSRISGCFNDTVTMSNMCIKAMGADYDGDTTRSKICFTIEANQEAKEIAESIRNFISPEGKLIRVVDNEAYLTFYNMTRSQPKGRVVSDAIKKELLALDAKKLTVNDIARLFGNTTKIGKDKKKAFEVTKPKYNAQDIVVLKAGEYTNEKEITTTVGRILFNKLMLEGTAILDLIPNRFYNEEVNAKKFGKLRDVVASGVMNGKLKIIPDVIDFTRNNEFWGLNLVAIFGTSYSMETIVPNKELLRKKDELLEQAKKNGGRLADFTDVEDKLVAEADRITAGTPGKFLFDSGARGSFENDFKNMAIAVGAVENPITGNYDFMTSSYMTGLRKEDLPAAANSVLNAEYPKAIGTAQGGYMTKQFYAVFQNMSIDADGTDCGSKGGLKMTLTEDNLGDYIDQYLMDNGKPVLITEDLDKKYMNHPVLVRSPMYCVGDKICSICGGRRFYKVGIDNIGLTTTALSGKLQSSALKLRHNLKIKMDHIDEKAILMPTYKNELLNDGKFIFVNTPYAEAYIPDDIFDNPNEDPRPSSLAYDTGEYVVTIGIFYMRFFDSDENTNAARDKTKLLTLCYPNKIETRPSGNSTRETLTINGVTDVYRVYRFYKGDILMEAQSKRSYINTEMFTKLVMAGKLPSSLTYDDLYLSWLKCFQINDISTGIPPVLQQGIISEMARNPDNPAEQFRRIAGKQKVDPHGYQMFSMNQVSAYSSVMSSMSFERYAEKLTTSLIMTKEGIEQKQSPIERIITI